MAVNKRSELTHRTFYAGTSRCLKYPLEELSCHPMLLWYLKNWQRFHNFLVLEVKNLIRTICQDKQTLVFQFILIFIIEALKEIKHQFFSGNDNTGYEPAFRTVSVADGTPFCVGHLFAAGVCNCGPSPNIFPSWILRYITGGVNSLMQELPAELSGSIFESLYKQVRL